jgi:hypothetical protein
MSNKHATLWNQYEEAAGTACRQGQFAKAARIVKEALREAEEYGETPGALVELAHQLAESYLQQLRFVEAESLFRAVLELREKLLGQTHVEVIDSLKKVAIVQIMAFRSETLGSKVLQTTSPWSAEQVAAAS